MGSLIGQKSLIHQQSSTQPIPSPGSNVQVFKNPISSNPTAMYAIPVNTKNESFTCYDSKNLPDNPKMTTLKTALNEEIDSYCFRTEASGAPSVVASRPQKNPKIIHIYNVTYDDDQTVELTPVYTSEITGTVNSTFKLQQWYTSGEYIYTIVLQFGEDSFQIYTYDGSLLIENCNVSPRGGGPAVMPPISNCYKAIKIDKSEYFDLNKLNL